MIKYPSIEQLRSVCSEVARRTRYVSEDAPLPSLSFTGTIKLHGSNGGVVVTKDSIVAQSRNQVLSDQNDNYGFFQFVSANVDYFGEIAKSFCYNDAVVIFGEWAGTGINGGTDISRLPRAFYIFDIRVDGKWLDKHSLFLL